MPTSNTRRRHDLERPRRPLWIWAVLAGVIGLVVAFLVLRGGRGDNDFYRSGSGVAPTAAGPEFSPLPGPGTEAPEVAADSSIDLGEILGGQSNTDPYVIQDPPTQASQPPVRAPEPSAPVNRPAVPSGPTASGPRNALPKSIPGQSPLPDYPRDAYRNQESGTVRVRATVDPQGNVVETRLEVSSRSTSLDRAAVNAVRSWKFTPAIRDGQPVQSDVIVPVEFTL